MYFHYFELLPLGRGQGPSFEQNWIPFTQGCIVHILVEIGSVVLEKNIFFFNFVNVFSLFCYYLPLEEDRALHLNKIEIPSSKDALCQVWLKLAQWFRRRRFLKFRLCFFRYFLIISLGKGRVPSFEQTWIPFTQGCFVLSLVEIGSVVLEKKIF